MSSTQLEITIMLFVLVIKLGCVCTVRSLRQALLILELLRAPQTAKGGDARRKQRLTGVILLEAVGECCKLITKFQAQIQ